MLFRSLHKKCYVSIIMFYMVNRGKLSLSQTGITKNLATFGNIFSCDFYVFTLLVYLHSHLIGDATSNE